MEEQADLSRALAWANAALGRTKTMPTYEKWMGIHTGARVLEGEELEQRAEEHAELVAEYEAAKARRDK